MRPIPNLDRSAKELYNETEAAAAVGISIARLHQLLDKHVFTGRNRRPESIQFTSRDFLLLSYWNSDGEPSSSHKVIPMPKRK